jgi:two-component system, OmpR family, sensor histidine kinase CpxA
MRSSLALKVTGWLLLNFLAVLVLIVGLMAVGGGLSWRALVEGPPGRRIETLVESSFTALVDHRREERQAALEEFAEANGVGATWLTGGSVGSDRLVAGLLTEIPPSLREALRPPHPRPRSESEWERSGPPDEPPGPPPAPPSARRRTLLVRDGQPVAFWLAVPLNKPGQPPGVIVLRIPTVTALFRLLDLTPWLAVALGVAGFSILFWLPFVRSLTGDLAKLTRATEAIAGGRFDTRVASGRRDELGTLGGAVNHMADRLDRLVTGQKRFLGDIAHELGSPLGRMQVSVEILEQRADPALRPAIHDVREEVEHMARLVEELLAFTRAGLQARPAVLASVELAPLVARVLAREAAHDAVRVQLADGVRVQADANLLDRALGNVIRNALFHAGRDATITLRLESSRTEVRLILEDSGPGVPTEALARLGEPLYRPDVARTREGGGSGLGLAIVKTCVEACGGTVEFSCCEPHGLRVTLRLAVPA